MVEPRKRSTKLRKVSYRSPGGKTKKRYIRRKTTKAFCSICKKRLKGVSTNRKVSKTRKRPGRKFSGELCHRCTQHVLKLKSRIENKKIAWFDVDIKFKRFVEQLLPKR